MWTTPTNNFPWLERCPADAWPMPGRCSVATREIVKLLTSRHILGPFSRCPMPLLARCPTDTREIGKLLANRRILGPFFGAPCLPKSNQIHQHQSKINQNPPESQKTQKQPKQMPHASAWKLLANRRILGPVFGAPRLPTI